MRKNRLIIILLLLILPLHCSLFAQESKKKQPVEAETPVMVITVADSNRLVVKNAPVGQNLEVFSLMGQKVKIIEIKNANFEYILNIPRSVYLVRAVGFSPQKIIIK